MAKVQLEVPTKKLLEICEEKELGESHATLMTARESISSHDSAPPSPPKSPPRPENIMSPMERARLALSKKALTKSARSQAKASAKLSVDMLARTSVSDIPYLS